MRQKIYSLIKSKLFIQIVLQLFRFGWFFSIAIVTSDFLRLNRTRKEIFVLVMLYHILFFLLKVFRSENFGLQTPADEFYSIGKTFIILGAEVRGIDLDSDEDEAELWAELISED